jgi:glycerol-1-phosphate dehydrogenase [NAD(P)+]
MLLARTIPAPVAITVRRGAVDGLAGLLADGRISSGGQVAVAAGPGQGERISERLASAVPAAEVHILADGTIEEARELSEKLRLSHYDALVGIGGGRTLDVAKFAASAVGLPFVAVATNLAHDGLASPVSSLASRSGRKVSYGVHVPIAVFVDLQYVAEAPTRFLRSGIGDVVSNLSAVADWQLAGQVHAETVDGLATVLSRNAAEAVLGSRASLTSDAFLTTLAESLIASGLAMTVAGSSRPCSGACHEIGHALDAFHGAPAPHGDQVAVGAMFASFLRNDPRIEAIDTCLRHYEVARLPSDLGIDLDTFVSAIVQAPGTRPGRFTILEHLDLGEADVRKQVHEFVEAYDR